MVNSVGTRNLEGVKEWERLKRMAEIFEKDFSPLCQWLFVCDQNDEPCASKRSKKKLPKDNTHYFICWIGSHISPQKGPHFLWWQLPCCHWYSCACTLLALWRQRVLIDDPVLSWLGDQIYLFIVYLNFPAYSFCAEKGNRFMQCIITNVWQFDS